jgi:hypothetical protein
MEIIDLCYTLKHDRRSRSLYYHHQIGSAVNLPKWMAQVIVRWMVEQALVAEGHVVERYNLPEQWEC